MSWSDSSRRAIRHSVRSSSRSRSSNCRSPCCAVPSTGDVQNALEQHLAQLELTLEELQSAHAEALAGAGPSKQHLPKRPARRPLPEHLPRETQTLTPAETACPACGGALKLLGEDVTEVLEYVPASFKVIRQVRPKLACCCCDMIVQAPAPSRPIARGLAGPGLLAHVLVSKYADHLPLYRQSAIYAREGVELPRSTLAEWVGGAHHLLRPLVAALRALRARDREAARRRHTDPGAGAGHRARPRRDGCGPMCAMTARRQRGGPGGVVRLLAEPQGRASAATPADVQRHPAGRCLRRLRCSV